MIKLSKAQAAKLAEIARMKHKRERGFSFMTPKSVKLLVDAGLVECNTTITDGNNVAVRSTIQGDKWLAAYEAALTEGTEPMNTEATAAPAFAINDGVPVPAIKRRGPATSIYPFDALTIEDGAEFGQSFFVPATEEMPNPGKSLASTVSSASKRYATENGTRTINRKVDGVMTEVQVPAYDYERKFIVRSVEENGVKGARVWRVAV
jgi:hypothetical protein